MLGMGIVGPISALPQIAAIYTTGSSGNVSMASYTMYLLGSIIGLVYALMHNLKALKLGYSLYLVANLIIVVGIALY